MRLCCLIIRTSVGGAIINRPFDNDYIKKIDIGSSGTPTPTIKIKKVNNYLLTK